MLSVIQIHKFFHWLDDFSQFVEALRDKGTGLLQGLVLGHRRLRRLVGTGACMAELNLRGAQFKKVTFDVSFRDLCAHQASGVLPSHLGGEHGGAGPDAPAHHRLGDPALFDGLADLVLLRASDLHHGGHSVAVFQLNYIMFKRFDLIYSLLCYLKNICSQFVLLQSFFFGV